MKKQKKIWKKVLLTILVLFVVILIGLIADNRICAAIYNGRDVDSDHLSEKEMERVMDVYESIDNAHMEGLTEETAELIIFNNSYEFLFSNNESEDGWEQIQYVDEIGRYYYRRKAQNPQAFARYVNGRYIGSFSTLNYYLKEIVTDLPIIIPPQLFSVDDTYYTAITIHEMVHAVQGNLNQSRLQNIEKVHRVSEHYYTSSEYEKLMKKESEYLQKAIDSDNQDDLLFYTGEFLKTRQERYNSCGMSAQEIKTEQELEWLEGTARYVEYILSRDSNSTIAKGLGKISEKVMTKSDDRFYTLGMAQVIILEELGINWQKECVSTNLTLQQCLENAIISK